MCLHTCDELGFFFFVFRLPGSHVYLGQSLRLALLLGDLLAKIGLALSRGIRGGVKLRQLALQLGNLRLLRSLTST